MSSTWSDNDGPPLPRGRFYQISTSSTATAEKLLVGDRKKQRQRRRPESVSGRPPSPVIHVRAYEKPSWLTSRGVSRKRKIIEAKGMPNMKNWRFITLTVDPNLHTCPLLAYLHGVQHMRRFLEACRKAKLWKRKTRWGWKFEFQQNTYPHWHLVVGHRYKWTHKQLAKLGELWAMGRTEVQRIEESKFGYGFKYAMKRALMPSEHGEDDEFERLAPDWFLDYIGKKTVKVDVTDEHGETVDSFTAEKPVTFRRVRFWQTSKDFYTGPKEKPRKAKRQNTWSVPVTVRDAIHVEGRTVQILARTWSGRYLSAACVALTIPLETFWGLIGFDTLHGGAVGLAVNSFVVPSHRLTTNTKTPWLVHPLLAKNQLKLHQAARLQSRGQTLRTC